MSDLRTRLTAVQLAHMGDPYQQDMGECPCGFKYSTDDELAGHVAHAVIRELKLREETVTFVNGPLMGFKGGPYAGCTRNGVNRRYVTEWETDD